MWTHFWDMHSGGGQKEKWHDIYIEAPEEEAKIIFYNRFGHNPDRVTCTCCGSDYSIHTGESLEQLTGFHRGCKWGYKNKEGEVIDKSEAYNEKGNLKRGYFSEYLETGEGEDFSFHKYQTLDEYKKSKTALFIYASDIKPEERVGEVPEQGYVWVD